MEKEHIVWDIKPKAEKESFDIDGSSPAKARSHTNGAFDVHTDASWNNPPPRALALSVLKCDRRGGGRFSVTSIKDVLSKLK